MRNIVSLTDQSMKHRGPSITSEIGDEYKKWVSGDIVMVSAPTGSGKSYFILHTLLEWVINESLRTNTRHGILYLVNRRILREQLLHDLNHEIQTILDMQEPRYLASNFITVMTYQEIESSLKSYQRPVLPVADYVVYDECHYFFSDSTFNPATVLSFDYLTRFFDQRVQIFMSATINDVANHLRSKYSKDGFNASTVARDQGQMFRANNKAKWALKEYTTEIDYSYIRIHGFLSEEEIPGIVTKNKRSKWLIFVDSIPKGKSLCEILRDDIPSKDNKDDVVFIDAEYEKVENARMSVRTIAKERISPAKIAICTSVLDNGVSFHDYGLRNIMILADTEEEFIQMLGRKRTDGKEVNLYICKRNTTFFWRRLDEVKKTRDLIEQYDRKAKRELQKTVNEHRLEEAYRRSKWAFGQKTNNNDAFKDLLDTCEVYVDGVRSGDIAAQELYGDIFDSEYIYRHIKKFCFLSCGHLFTSYFSINRLAALEKFYEKMYKAMKNDENAFLKEQVGWLGLDRDNSVPFVKSLKAEDKEKHISSLRETMEGYVGEEIPSTEKKGFFKKIRDDLVPLMEADAESAWNEKVINDVKYGELSKENFNKIMACKFINLPYQMKGIKTESKFMIVRLEQTDENETDDE